MWKLIVLPNNIVFHLADLLGLSSAWAWALPWHHNATDGSVCIAYGRCNFKPSCWPTKLINVFACLVFLSFSSIKKEAGTSRSDVATPRTNDQLRKERGRGWKREREEKRVRVAQLFQIQMQTETQSGSGQHTAGVRAE